MLKVGERISQAQQSLLQSEAMQRLDRMRQSIGRNSMVRQLALAPRSIGRRVLTSFAIAFAAAAISLFMSNVPPLSGSMRNINLAAYDSFFSRRFPQNAGTGEVVMILADDGSLKRMKNSSWHVRWPWPRDTWAAVIKYLEACHARVIAFDMTFDEPSDHETTDGDDTAFAEALDASTIPIVIAERVPTQGNADFAPPVKKPVTFGAANIEETTVRTYRPTYRGVPTFAIQVLSKGHFPIPAWANQPFNLHYYGPSRRPDGRNTFQQVPAMDVVLAAQPDAKPIPAVAPDVFRDKIVLIGASAPEAFDLKSSPIDPIFPGTEAQATAITNMLDDRYVHILGMWTTFAIGFVGAFLAAAGAVIPQRAYFKLIVTLLAIVGIFAASYLLFVGNRNIYWLALAMPMQACAIATVGGLAWTYLVEGRQRRVLRKFLAQFVSPDVAARLDAIGTVSLGGVKRELSMLFSDIAGFTDLSEKLTSDELEKFMNFYLSEMSAVVFANNGTLDKYIGDAIMTFWNAPLDQSDHAMLACRTALRMHQREEEIRPMLAAMKAGEIHTRIGVNTGPANVGNYGSLQKLNYTCLGDNVNLASRLEGANKIYGTNILVAEPTVLQCKDRFLFRKLDLLRVKGKKIPMAVYELIAEKPGNDAQQRVVREYGAALAAYQKQEWDEAERMLIDLLQFVPDDGPAAVLLERAREFRVNPPPTDWDGSHVAKDK